MRAGSSFSSHGSASGSGISGATATLNLNGAVGPIANNNFNTFTGAVTITGGANSASNNAIVNLRGNAKFNGGVVLKDTTSHGKAHLQILGRTANQRIEGDIKGDSSGATAGNGTLTINNKGKIATFTGVIGGTNVLDRLALVRVGPRNAFDGHDGSHAVFQQNVNSHKFEIRTAFSSTSTKNSSVTFKGDLNVTNTTDGFKLIRSSATNTNAKPIAIFNGTQNQTVNAKITVERDGTGVVKVQNTGGTVKFQQTIGNSNKRLGEMEIDSGATAEFEENAYINTVKGGGTIKLSGILNQSLNFKDSFGTANLAMNISVRGYTTAKLLASSDKTAYTSITLGGAGATLNLGDSSGAVSVTGDVKTNVNGEGILKIVGVGGKTTIITGNIGEDGKALKTLDLGKFGSKVTGDVHAKTIQFSTTAGTTNVMFGGNVTAETSFKFDHGNHSAAFNGTGPQTITGAITANADGDGRIVVSNTEGIVTFKGKIGEGGTTAKRLTNVELRTNTKTVFNDEVHTNTLMSQGRITFNKAGSSVKINLGMQTGSKITLGNGITNGQTVIKLGGQLLSLKGRKIKVNMPSSLADGQSINLLKGNGVTNAKFNDSSFEVNNNALFNYTAKLDNTNKAYKITANKKSTAQTASSLGVKTSSAKALDNANKAVSGNSPVADKANKAVSGNSPVADKANKAVMGFSPVADSANKALSIGDKIAFTALNKALNAGGGEAKKAAEQLNIQADMLDAGATAAVGTGTQVMSVASSRLATLRTGVQYAGTDRGGFQSGFASGDEALSKATWLKPFGSWVRQDAKGDVAGYDADTGGIALGIDAEVSDGVRLGTSFAYSTTKVTGKGEGKSKTDVKSYQWTVYADHTADEFYVEGMLGYAVNSSKSSRRLTFGGLNRTAKGDYDSTQYMAGVGGGMPMQVKTDVFVTPTAGLSYTRVSSDSYTETGAGNLNLKVKPDDVDVLIASLGAKAHTHIKQGDGTLVPSARAGLSYDFMADQATATGTYTGGGAAFKVKGMKAEKLAGNFGLGLAYDDGAWSVGANYDAEVKSGYTGHSASLEARVKF